MGIVLIPLNVGISSNVRRLIEETVRRPGDERPPSPSAPSHAARAAKLNYIAAVFYLTELGYVSVARTTHDARERPKAQRSKDYQGVDSRLLSSLPPAEAVRCDALCAGG